MSGKLSSAKRRSISSSGFHRQFELPDVPPGTVIAASTASAPMGPAARLAGVAQFEAAMQAAR